MQAFIYHLYENDCDIPVYVGQTINPRQRFAFHRTFNGVTCPREAWITETRRRGGMPRMEVVDEVSAVRSVRTLRNRALAAEKAEAQRLMRQGVILINGEYFWACQPLVPPDVRARFRSLLQERGRMVSRKVSRRAISLGLLDLARQFPALDVGHFYRYDPHFRPAAEPHGKIWGYSLR